MPVCLFFPFYQPCQAVLFFFSFIVCLFACLSATRSCDSTSVPEAPTRGRCHCGSWRTAQAPRASADCGVQPGSPGPRGTGEPCQCPSTGRRTGTTNTHRFHTFAACQSGSAELDESQRSGRHPSGRPRTEASGSSACLLLLSPPSPVHEMQILQHLHSIFLRDILSQLHKTNESQRDSCSRAADLPCVQPC